MTPKNEVGEMSNEELLAAFEDEPCSCVDCTPIRAELLRRLELDKKPDAEPQISAQEAAREYLMEKVQEVIDTHCKIPCCPTCAVHYLADAAAKLRAAIGGK